MTGGDEPTPLMPDEQARIIKEIPRDPETIELSKNLPEPDLYHTALKE